VWHKIKKVGKYSTAEADGNTTALQIILLWGSENGGKVIMESQEKIIMRCARKSAIKMPNGTL